MRPAANAPTAPRRAAVILLALALGPGTAELDAQIAEGDTVRITIGSSRGIYQLRALRNDTVVVQEGDRTFGIARSRIERIELGTRRGPERFLYAALAGVAIGGLAGALLGIASGDDDTTCEEDTGTFCFKFGYSAREKAAAGAAVLGAVGGIGGIIIAARSPWSWKEVGEADLAIRAIPHPARLSLRVSFLP